jgi:hypothetical protein
MSANRVDRKWRVGSQNDANDPSATLALRCGNGLKSISAPIEVKMLSPELGGHMQRREFITFVGSAAAAWPLAARAQQAARMLRIGILLNASSDDPQYQAWVGAFLQELAQLGWVIGRNVRIDTGTRNFLGEVRSDRGPL